MNAIPMRIIHLFALSKNSRGGSISGCFPLAKSITRQNTSCVEPHSCLPNTCLVPIPRKQNDGTAFNHMYFKIFLHKIGRNKKHLIQLVMSERYKIKQLSIYIPPSRSY